MDIYVAYNDILVYNEDGGVLHPNSNVANYDVHPDYTGDFFRLNEVENALNIKFPYTLNGEEDDHFYSYINYFNSQNFQQTFFNPDGFYIPVTIDKAIEKGENFLFPIILYNNDLFEKYDTIELSDEVVNSVRKGKCRILFTQLTEGFLGVNEHHYNWFSNLSEKYGFSKYGVVVVTSNLTFGHVKNDLVKKGKIKDNFTAYPYPYFEGNLWFYHYGHVFLEHMQKAFDEDFEFFLNKNRNEKKEYHFLCFNRIIKPHRNIMFGELMSNPNLVGKSITTLSAGNKSDHLRFELNNDYGVKELRRLYSFYKRHDSEKHYVYDELDLENNKANVFNKDAHAKTFLNIVTESLTYDNCVFFSEKTYKPIASLQPFIIVGNPNSLKILKEQGYQTFSEWWDESYDNEINFTRRMRKTVDLLEEISSWSLDKCFKITNEMEEVLIHNQKVLRSGKRLLDLNNYFLEKKLM